MPGISDDDLRKIREYAERIIPPDFQDQIRMEVDVRGNTVTIVECRPPWREDSDPEWTRQGVARMKFAPADEKWTLYWSDRNSRWHVFDLITPGAIGKILREVERDQTNIFWG